MANKMKTENTNHTPRKQSVRLPEHGKYDKNGREILLSLKNVDITFGKGNSAVKAVRDASFDIYRGETFSLVGESGSGKTTIGRAVIRANSLSAGEIDFKGVRISGKIPRSLDREVIRDIQMVFQDPAASLNERATVEYIISEGLYNFHLFRNKEDRIRKVENIIKEVGLLPEHLSRYPHEFSGGQRQRIGLARAMVMEPELVVADEPISALDVSVRAQVLNLMKKLQQEKQLTYLFIAHDLSIVRFISDRIGVIYKGRIVEIADSEELFNFPLHPYTRSLISAIPIPDPVLEKNKVLYTYNPDIHNYTDEEPMLTDIGHNHLVYGSKKEIDEYKEIRRTDVPVNVITVDYSGGKSAPKMSDTPKCLTSEETICRKAAVKEEQYNKPNQAVSFLITAAAFLLPLIGLAAMPVIKRSNCMKYFSAVRKGTIAGLTVWGIIIVIFPLLILPAVL